MKKILQNQFPPHYLEMNQLYYYFSHEKEELKSLLSKYQIVGFFTDINNPMDKAIVFQVFQYILAPLILDYNYCNRKNTLIFSIFDETLERNKKENKISVLFEKDYKFYKLALVKKREEI